MALDLEHVRAVAERVAASLGLEVVEVGFRGGGKARLLRVTIDKPAGQAASGAAESGVTHEDCANVSREVSTILDVEDPVPGGPYTLEVSSPGLDRKLVRPADYRRFVGSRVKLMTRQPVAAQPNGGSDRYFEGRLEKFEDGRLTLDITPVRKKKKPAPTERRVEVELANVEKANLSSQ